MVFTYKFPDSAAFLYTMRELLGAEGKAETAAALVGVDCDFQTHGQFSQLRWNSYSARLVVRVPIAAVHKFTPEIKDDILNAVARIFPTEAGYDLVWHRRFFLPCSTTG